MGSSLRIGVDTGGTFTDVILAIDGRLAVHKLPSTPADPARAVVDGIAAVLESASASGSEAQVIHGSTVATNALLEGKGGRAAFITTKGFADTLFIGRQDRGDLYSLEPEPRRVPLLREHCLEVDERVLADGSVHKELGGGEVHKLAAQLHLLGIDSVAISLLHSYANPTHEQQLAAALRRQLPGVHVTASSELLPEFREYERAATCLVNAAVALPMVGYLKRLEDHFGGERLRIMASAGGSLPVAEVQARPVTTILSGPAGGVVGALHMARPAGEDNIITFDMGGTSTDVALCDGGISRTTESEAAGLPVRLPVIDIHTVGAGGGSIARIDSGGALLVGPESLGADPGPACYGRQQGQGVPAVTDAHVVLGHISAGQPLGEGLRIDADASHRALEPLAQSMGISVEEAALGVLRVAEATMARAIQRISVERGHDPRDYALVPFGGAGGLHAARLAEFLGIGKVVVPADAGLLSALGMLVARPRYDYSQGLLLVVERGGGGEDIAKLPEVSTALDELNGKGRAALAADGIAPSAQEYKASVDLRYAGQSFELTLPLAGGCALAAFEAEHERLFGYKLPGKQLELTAVRLEALGPPSAMQLPQLAQRESGVVEDIMEQGRVYTLSGWQRAALIQRASLRYGDVFTGPAVVQEYSATTLVPGGWRVTVNKHGHMLLARGAQ